MTTYRPFRKKKPYSLTIFIIFAAIFLSVSAFNGLFGVRYLINGIVYPFQFIASSAISGVLSIPASVISLKNLATENAELKNKLDAANAKLIIMDELAIENERLLKDLNFQRSLPYASRAIPAKIIARGSAPYLNLVEINLGASRGIKKNMAVIVPEGIVGRAYGAKTTPHMFIVAADGVVVYAGGIDDDRSADVLGKINHVAQALGEILAGKAVSVPESQPYGCSVKYTEQPAK